MASRSPRNYQGGGEPYEHYSGGSHRPRSSSYAAVGNGNGEKHGGAAAGKGGRKKWPWVLLVLLVIAAAIAIPVGVVYGTKNNNKNQNEAASGQQGGGSGGSSSGGSSGRGSSASATSSSAAPTATVAAKKKWDWTPGADKMVGINTGNFLVLERWMDEDWFTSTASLNAWDEWSFCQTLGDRAAQALEDHWNSWLTDADLDTLKGAGINSLRIPTGYWMWIPTIAGEPYVTTGQKAQLDRILKGAYDRDMYIVIDLHGLPGSQNGEQQSGHNTTNPTFYQPLNQARADATVKAVVDYVGSSPYYSIISAIEVANEPRPYTPEQYAMLKAYYERSYDTIQTLGDKAPAMMFADGFFSGNKIAFWSDLTAGRTTSPPSLLFTDHPYPGYFPAQTDAQNILQQTCTAASRYSALDVPTVITEWSLRTGIQDTAFEKQYYIQQLTAWSWYGGSAFWNFKTVNSTVQVLADTQQYQWSFLGLLEHGSIPTPATPNTSTQDFLDSLGNPCGNPQPLASAGSTPGGAGADTARASAAAVNALTDSVDGAAQAAATSWGYAGIGASATPTGGSAAALQATASAGSRMARERRHAQA